jgi:phytol kinase
LVNGKGNTDTEEKFNSSLSVFIVQAVQCIQMAIFITLAVIFGLLCINEFWWRTRKHAGEISRKFTHITVGVFTAFWPLYLSFTEIKLLSLAYLIVVIFSKRFNVFKSVHSVERSTWGEVCFALSVGILAFLTHDKWIYAAAILQMALADGLAAIIGVSYGKRSRYTVLGQTKSVVGTATFFVVSFVILIVFKQTGHLGISFVFLGLISLVAAGI